MVEVIFLVILNVFLLVWLLSCIIFSVVLIVSKWRCRRKKYDCLIHRCHNKKCLYRGFCECYEYVYTREELAELREIVEKLET